MADQVRRAAADCLNDAGDVTGQIVQCRAVERTATASDAAHINRDRQEPSGSQHARQLIKITGATARIREQHDWCARTAKYAFQSRVTDVDASMLLQSHLPLFTAYRARLPYRANHLPRDPTLLPKLPNTTVEFTRIRAISLGSVLDRSERASGRRECC
jgi:hypothetical protein